MGGWPRDPADTKLLLLLLLPVAPGALVLFLNFLFEMFQQSQFRFGREGRQAGWVGCCCFPGASSRQQLCSHKALDAAVVFPAKLCFKHGKLSSPHC